MTNKTTKEKNTEGRRGNFTTVKTVYARIALVLLTLNFCLTSYVIVNINKETQTEIDGMKTFPRANVTLQERTLTLPELPVTTDPQSLTPRIRNNE